MASKWKYASLDANHRIGLLRKGNKELFDEEVARTKEVTKARRELGLDTTEQEKWMDTVGYNYNLSQAGVGDKVSELGYAQLYLDGKKADTEMSPVKRYKETVPQVTGYISAANRKIDNALKLAEKSLVAKYEDRKKEVYNELYDRYPHLKEQILNEGASPEGGKLKRAYDSIEQELSVLYEELDNELSEKLSELGKKYAGFKDQIMEYRRNGTAKESLGVIADVLIKNAAMDDDFDPSVIPGTGSKVRVKALGADTDDTVELSKEAAELIARYPKKKDADAYGDKDSDNGMSIREEKTPVNELSRMAEFIVGKLKDEPENAVLIGNIGELLIRNGMSPDAVARFAAEIMMLALNREAKKQKGSAV